jgi:hypothetical protein
VGGRLVVGSHSVDQAQVASGVLFVAEPAQGAAEQEAAVVVAGLVADEALEEDAGGLQLGAGV